MKEIKIKAKENDNCMRVHFLDGKADEFLFGHCSDGAFTVIGFKDMKRLLKKAGYKMVKI